MPDHDARPLAAVTGASTGIGRELARQFARNGFDLVIAADDAALDDAREELARVGAGVEAVRVDLATPAGVERLHQRILETGRPLDALALNAGIGENGPFADSGALARHLRVVDVNVRGTVHLAGLLLPALVARGAGRILLTSSIAAALPGSQQATYNASKAFLQSFGLALRDELRGTGVTVTLLMPGPADTRFFARNAMRGTRIASGRKDDPADVARDGFEALMAGRERVVSHSPIAKLEVLGSRLLPDAVKAGLNRVMARPGSGG
jgi:short-subunit dehydrogenase